MSNNLIASDAAIECSRLAQLPGIPIGFTTSQTIATVTVEDPDPLTLTVSIPAANASNMSCMYETVDGTAMVGHGYVYSNGTINITAGQLSNTFQVQPLYDEDGKYFTVHLTPQGGVDVKVLTQNMTVYQNELAPPPVSVPNGGIFLYPGLGNAWDNSTTIPEKEIWDENTNLFWGVYEGRNASNDRGIGLWSTPDHINYTKYSLNPILEGDWAICPGFYHENGTTDYYILTCDASYNLVRYYSTNVTGPYTYSGIMLEVGPDGSWYDATVSECDLIKYDGVFYLAFMGYSVAGPDHEQVGIAYADNINDTFTVNPGPPQCGYNPINGSWDENLEADPWWYFPGDGYAYLFYAGGSGLNGKIYWEVGVARAPEDNILGSNFDRCPSNPTFERVPYNASEINATHQWWRGSAIANGSDIWYIHGGRYLNNSAYGFVQKITLADFSWNIPVRSWNNPVEAESGDPRLSFNGTWYTNPSTNYFNDTALYSNTLNATITLNFTGTGIRTIMRFSDAYAIAGISVDSGPEQLIDMYGLGVTCDGCIAYQKTGLSDGQHSITIRNTHTRNTAANNWYVGVDRFEIQNYTISFNIAASQTSITESNSQITLTVTKNMACNWTTTVDVNAIDGSASNGQDYSLANTTLTFAPNDLTKTVVLSILDDTLVEGTESFTVRIENATGGATIAEPSSITITITDSAGYGVNPDRAYNMLNMGWLLVTIVGVFLVLTFISGLYLIVRNGTFNPMLMIIIAAGAVIIGLTIIALILFGYISGELLNALNVFGV